MLNYNYVREIINTILNLDKLDNKRLYYSINKKNINELKLYTIYVNPFINSKELNVSIENLYILTHLINGIEYKYNNLTEEEINIISNTLRLLNVQISKISIPELKLKEKVISKNIEDILNKVTNLENDILALENVGLMIDAHKKNIEAIRIEKDLNSINVPISISDRRKVRL